MEWSHLPGMLYYLSLLGYAMGFMSVLPKLKMGGALLSAQCAMLFLSYWGVIILGLMPKTAFAVLILGWILLLLGVIFSICGICDLRRRINSPALWIYGGMACLGFVLLSGYVVTDHDAYSYWARAAKELYTFEQPLLNANNNMSHLDYNPIFASLQYCITRVFGWQEAYLPFVNFGIVGVCLAALCDLFEKKRNAVLFFVPSLYLYGSFFQSSGSLVVDGTLSLLFTAALLLWCFRTNHGMAAWLPALCAMAVLPAVKLYSGLLFALALWAVAGMEWLGERKRIKKEPSERKNPSGRLALLGLALVLLMEFSWSGYYHWHSRTANYENQVAQIVFDGSAEAATLEPPRFQLSDLFAGNPRNESLSHALTAENLEKIGKLAGQTGTNFVDSPLFYLLLISLGMIFWQLMAAKGLERKRRKRVFICLCVMAVCYTLGLFGSYFVQEEVSGGALNYLKTVCVPFGIAGFLFVVRSLDQQRKPLLSGIALAVLSIVLVVWTNPVSWWGTMRADGRYFRYGEHTHAFFAEELGELLTEQDKGERAMVVDNTWEATQYKSWSGFTHAYQYYAMPMRVFVYHLPYGEYDGLEAIVESWLTEELRRNRCTLLILRMEDTLYMDAFAQAMQIDSYADYPWVIDVAWETGEPVYALRNIEEE